MWACEEDEIPSDDGVRVRTVRCWDVCVSERIVFHVVCYLSPVHNRLIASRSMQVGLIPVIAITGVQEPARSRR